MLGASLPMPHVAYRMPPLLETVIGKEALAKYGAVLDLLLQLRWHARVVQQSVSVNLKSQRSAEERQAQLLGFVLLHSANALIRYSHSFLSSFVSSLCLALVTVWSKW